MKAVTDFQTAAQAIDALQQPDRFGEHLALAGWSPACVSEGCGDSTAALATSGRARWRLGGGGHRRRVRQSAAR